jgi:hypothetical protein
MTSFSGSPAPWFKGRFSHPSAAFDPLSAAIEPSNDMIVLPFHHACRNNFGMIPVRTQDDFMLVSPSHYDPERYPRGSCIQ